MPAVSRRLVLLLILSSLTMAFGFWLKWRILSPFDPVGWYLRSTSEFAYTDIIGIYIERGVAGHPMPYAEMALEYPPVTGIVMYLASFAPGPIGYLVANYAVLALAGLGTVWMLYLLRPKAPIWVFAVTPPLALYAGLNWDILPIFFTMASLVLFQRKRDGWATLALALGVWAKLFPILFLPIMALQRAKDRDWRSLAVMGGIFGLISVAVNLPFALLNFSGWRHIYDFHSYRSPDGGSVWTAIGQLPISIVNGLSLTIVVAGLLVIGLDGIRNRRTVVGQGMAILLVFMLVNKASSPQYDLWLVPFLVLLPTPLWLIGFFLVADLAYYTAGFNALHVLWGGQNAISGFLTAAWEPIAVLRYLALLLLFFRVAIRRVRFERLQ